MSGNNGNGSGPHDPHELDCSTLSFNTTVNSPNPEVIAMISVQQQLELRLLGEIVVVGIPRTQDVLGSVNHTNTLRLIECMREGHDYVAVVREIQDGLVRIQVHSS